MGDVWTFLPGIHEFYLGTACYSQSKTTNGGCICTSKQILSASLCMCGCLSCWPCNRREICLELTARAGFRIFSKSEQAWENEVVIVIS